MVLSGEQCNVYIGSTIVVIQMTARYDMYAQELAEVIKPDYKPQIVHQ